MRRFLVGLLSVAAVLCAAACGDTDGDAAGTTAAPAKAGEAADTQPSCKRARKVLVAALESSLTINGGGGLKRVSIVRVDDSSDAPLPGFQRGVYAVAGEFTGPGMDGTIGIWAVSRDMVRTGGGLAIGADSVTREFSDLGAAAAAGSPAADYAAEVADSAAGQEARRCAEGD
jgi:hypothetical protein